MQMSVLLQRWQETKMPKVNVLTLFSNQCLIWHSNRVLKKIGRVKRKTSGLYIVASYPLNLIL